MIKEPNIRTDPKTSRSINYWLNTHTHDLMQYTGLKDKNGVEIYEGDMINSYQNDYMPTEVYYDEDLAQFVTTNYHSTLSLINSIGIDTVVLGNIYENPELLK